MWSPVDMNIFVSDWNLRVFFLYFGSRHYGIDCIPLVWVHTALININTFNGLPCPWKKERRTIKFIYDRYEHVSWVTWHGCLWERAPRSRRLYYWCWGCLNPHTPLPLKNQEDTPYSSRSFSGAPSCVCLCEHKRLRSKYPLKSAIMSKKRSIFQQP